MAKSCGATQPGADRFSYPLIVFFSALILVGCSMFDDDFTEVARKGMTCSKKYSFSDVTIDDIDVGCSGRKCVSSFSIGKSGSGRKFNNIIYEGDLSKIENGVSVSVSIKNCNIATSVSENWGPVAYGVMIALAFFILSILGAAAKEAAKKE